MALASCEGGTKPPAIADKLSAAGAVAADGDRSGGEIKQSELEAAQGELERECERPTVLYEGSIAVNARDYLHPVERGDDFIDEPIPALDRVVIASSRVEFTLDYPFEKPFSGVVTGQITLRRIIDGIRAGFRTMYEGTTQRDIPGMMNKDVTGRYGRAFHVIDDLVIEGIDFCADGSLSISIGS
jgi:hypothetical protein